jgi:hypothetical protein
MPRPKPVSDINYLTKTEKMTSLPISYYLKNKTERMVDLPALYYGNNVPALETNGLIYFLDGVGYSKVGSIWYNSADKAGVSKTSATLVGPSATFGPPYIFPIQEEKSFRFVNGLTGALLTDLSSDLFNGVNQGVFTLSAYFKVNSFISTSNGRLFTIARSNVANTSWAVYFRDNTNPGIFFRALNANFISINANQKYLVTVVRNNAVFSYYLNNKFFRSETPTLSGLIPPLPSTNVVIGSGLNSITWLPTFTSSSNIYSFSAYNRALSAQEISNNYQYFKQRYE